MEEQLLLLEGAIGDMAFPFRYLYYQNQSLISAGNVVTLLINGEEMFPALLKRLKMPVGILTWNSTFFKKLKQNLPLTYFFGDNANALKLNSDAPSLLLYLKMAFSISATIIRLHIMDYVDLSAKIEAYKRKRKRFKKMTNLSPHLKKQHPYFTNQIRNAMPASFTANNDVF